MPLTMDEIRYQTNKHDRTAGFVAVDPTDLIDNDSDGILDLLSERLTGGPLLTDITYEMAGFNDGDNTLRFKVVGDGAQVVENDDWWHGEPPPRRPASITKRILDTRFHIYCLMHRTDSGSPRLRTSRRRMVAVIEVIRNCDNLVGVFV